MYKWFYELMQLDVMLSAECPKACIDVVQDHPQDISTLQHLNPILQWAGRRL